MNKKAVVELVKDLHESIKWLEESICKEKELLRCVLHNHKLNYDPETGEVS